MTGRQHQGETSLTLFFSPHGNLVHFAFADGSVRALSSSVDFQILQALATRADGEVVDGRDL